MRTLLVAIALSTCAGCYATVEPGHHALRFEPNSGGVRPVVLGPGRYRLGPYDRLEDFDITYSTNKEVIHTTSAEGAALDVHLAVIYRPIAAELYELDTEIGRSYYDEVVGPEFRSAARGVFARHSYTELAKANEKIEDEIEADLRRRIRGKHVDVSSITMEHVEYAHEITAADQSRLIGEREAARQKAQIENEALKQQLALKLQAEQAKQQAERAAEQAKADAARAIETDRRELERAMRGAQSARAIAEEESKMAKAQAQAQLIKAHAEAEQRVLLAHASAEERKAEAQGTTWLEVQKHAYDALGKLGGEGTHILIGDWAKLPNFLFPRMGPGMTGGYPTNPTSYRVPAKSKGETKTTKLPSDEPYGE
jgi:regulator of protease activity HflC (stomatin/prohibitin superfamily)